ncbi:MAG: hypothetical protein K0R29_2669 [Pseudobdellovibrio sp.]|nr:hypothetical protein [Pseudobdellovibrio sp.]
MKLNFNFKYIDPRHVQIFNNVCMMIYGAIYLNFSRKLTYAIPAFIISLAIDYYFSRYLNEDRDKRSLYDRAVSVINTMASVYIIVNVQDPRFYFLTICFGILAKFIFRVGNQHVFNPANVGIVLSLLFISDASVRIIYTQFATPKMFLFWFVLFNGILITLWAKRWIVALAYMLGSCLFLYFLAPYYGFTETMMIGPTFSTSGILFTFFMITDPKTTPGSAWGQVSFGLVCALIGAWFRLNQMVHDAFVALFLTTALYSVIRFTPKKAVPVATAKA